jgi:predicted transcriptional regulator YdeE
MRRFGGNSQQAINRWHQLNAERENCWNRYHAWWHPGDQQWHTERDWDRYDQRGHVIMTDHGPVRDKPRDPDSQK